MKSRLILILFVVLSAIDCLAEGSKQLRPDTLKECDLWIIPGGGDYSCFANETCPPDQQLYIHIAHPGEKIYMGFHAHDGNNYPLSQFIFKLKFNGSTVCNKHVSSINGAPGYITYDSQAIAGPDVLQPNGYHAVTFSPLQAGDYSIEFILQPSSNIKLKIYDITVIDTTETPYHAVDGRLWSKDWNFSAYAAFLGKMYILTEDSVVTSVNYNSMMGMLFDVTSTKNGCFPWPYPWESSCLSREGNHHYPQYKLFVNNPDSVEYPTGVPGKILGDTVNVTRGCDGTFLFKYVVNKPGTVKFTIESNLEPGIQQQDLIIYDTIFPGLNTLFWDGLNNLGQKVTCGDSVQVSVSFVNGLTNLALFDVEVHHKGFSFEAVRPQGSPIASYWNDTLLAYLGGTSQLSGCYFVPPDNGCHKWGDSTTVILGDNNTINTWWYYTNELNLGRFMVECIPVAPSGITGPTTLCTSSAGWYTTVPNPIPGSDRFGYEWVLADAASGVIHLDSVDTGSSLKIFFKNYPPGEKRLKVRGKSFICGAGPFGPGINGEGILINTIFSPSITNTITSFAICSGDTTNITLTASMPGTTYSYTASASSPLITGFTSGNQNPIRQVCINSDTTIGTVYYHVVPYLDPCFGDTVTFAVNVIPTSELTFQIAASSNPVCMGKSDTFSVTNLIGGENAIYQWFVNGMVTGPNAPVFNYIPANEDKVQCSIISSEFCTPGKIAYSQKISVTVIQVTSADVGIVPNANPICMGHPVTLRAIPVNGGDHPSFQWLLNGIVIGTDTSLYTFVPENGDQVICILTSNLQCVNNNTTADTFLIHVIDPHKVTDTTLCYGTPYFVQGDWQTTAGTYYDTLVNPVSCIRFIKTHLSYKAAIQVDLGDDTTLCGNAITLNAYILGASCQWQDGSNDSIYVVTLPGEYSVTVTYDGCANSDSIKIGECPVLVLFPNAFTPNNDGLNDTFCPISKGIEKFSMQIFDRWGTLLFETSSPEMGWNGYFKGSPCPEGTYVYKASFKINGVDKQHTGTMTLLQGIK